MTEKYEDEGLDSALGFGGDEESWEDELNETLGSEESDGSIPGLEEEYEQGLTQPDVEVEPDTPSPTPEPESEDDDAIQPKGLLSTGSGKFVVVAGVVVVAVAAGGAYTMLSKGGSSQQMPKVADATVKTSSATIEENSAPNLSPEMTAIDQSPEGSMDDGFSLGGAPKKPEVPTSAPSPDLVNEEPVVAERAQDANGKKVPGFTLDLENDDSEETQNGSERTSVNTASDINEKTESPSVVAQQPSFAESEIKSKGLSKEEIQQIVSEVISREIKKNAGNNQSAEVVNTLQSIQLKVDQLDRVIKKQSEKVDVQADKVKEIAETVVEKPKKKSQPESKRYPAHVVDGLKEGRSRLPGFKVFNSTEDGTMSVVKTPSGNVNVYFKGERFYIAGNKLVKVESIHDDGYLVLVTGGYYIDETLVEKKAAPKPAPKKIAKKTQEKKTGTQKSTKAKPATEREIVPVEDTRRIENGREVLTGWSLNAIFGGDKSYLLTSPDGNWDTWATGDTIEGAGIISGLDDDRNLIVGNKVILLSK